MAFGKKPEAFGAEPEQTTVRKEKGPDLPGRRFDLSRL
jgi:hypothetical protein